MASKIFEDKTTMEEARVQWPQRTAMSLNEPQSRNASMPGLRINGDMDVKNVVRPRKGHDY